MAYIHYKNRQVNKDLDKSSFFKDIYKLKPAAFLTLGNEFFMSRLYDHLRVCYHEVDLIKPALFHLDRTHANQKHEFLGYLDHCFSTLPKKAVNY